MKYLLLLLALMQAGCAASPSTRAEDNAQRSRAKLHTELGAGYYAQGMMAVALDEFNESVRVDPSYAIGHAGIGLVYAALKEDDKADAGFRRALELDPQSSETHNNYGTFLCSRNRVDESIREFMTAVKNPLYPTPEMAYLNAGVCALKKNDEAAAETYFSKALQAQPNLNQANYHLANIHFERGDALQARQFLQRSMLNTDPTPEMLWLGVRIERRLGGGDAEASYRLLLKNKYPNSAQTKAMLSGE